MPEKTETPSAQDQIIEKMTDLQTKAASVLEKLESAEVSPEDQKALKEQSEDIGNRLAVLESEKKAVIAEEERKAVLEQLEDVKKRLDEGRKPHAGFHFGRKSEENNDSPYGEDQARSFYSDVKSATHEGSRKATERLEQSIEGKAMKEGSDAAGGFLVPPEVSNNLIELRKVQSVLRSLFSQVNVTSDEFQIPSQTSGLTAGWVAELATKPEAEMAFASTTVNVFTAAGLAVSSNQLLKDANWSVDRLINTDLAFRLAQLEEIAFINGSGTNQPRGILNTSGIGTVAFASGGITVLLDKIVTAITEIYTEYKGPPDAIVMHPRTWAAIATAREATAPSTYLVGLGGSAWGRRANDALPGYGSAGLPTGELFGLPVYTTPNIPTNLGTGTNESRVIVGNFKTGLILDREDVQYATSEHVYFTSNQTVFRAEERLGFTAARYPKAFSVVQGAGLAGI